MEDFKRKWEDWYGDLLSAYQWIELEYKGKTILYVHGCTRYTGDEGPFSADFIQVIGHADSGESIAEDEHEEIRETLKGRHGIDNISFWLT